MTTTITFFSATLNKTLELELRTTNVQTHSILSEYQQRLAKAIRMEIHDIIGDMTDEEIERITNK